MPNTVRTTSANRNGARDLQEKPLQSSAKNPACQTGSVVPNSPPEHFTPLSVRPDEREIFLPSLDPGRVYQVTVHGTFACWEQGLIFRGPKTHADALYEADHADNFVREHDWLSFYDDSQREHSWRLKSWLREDRAAHKYTFRIRGTASRVSARLSPPRGTQWNFRAEGALTIFVELLPEGSSLSFVTRQQKTLEEYLQEKAAAEEKVKREKKAAEERTALENKLALLQCRAHREDFFIDPNFQQKYARHHLQEISSKLKGEWASEYDALMQQPGFKELAAKEAPEVLHWLESRVNIVRFAEQLIASPPDVQGRKKRKLNAEEVRALIVRRDGIQAEDRIARTRLKAEKLLEARAVLESIPLDPDVKESLTTELDQEIRDIGEDNGKGGTTL
jgi:hypothetical protein